MYRDDFNQKIKKITSSFFLLIIFLISFSYLVKTYHLIVEIESNFYNDDYIETESFNWDLLESETLLHNPSDNDLLDKGNLFWKLTPKQKAFLNKTVPYFSQYPVDMTQSNQFDQLRYSENDHFSTLEELEAWLNSEKLNQNYTPCIDFKSLIKLMQKTNCDNSYWKRFSNLSGQDTALLKQFIKNIYYFYNIMDQLYSPEVLRKLVYEFKISDDKNTSVLATTNYYCNNNSLFFNNPESFQFIVFYHNAFNNKILKKNYLNGRIGTYNILTTLVHEYGHALDNYISSSPAIRSHFNNLAGNPEIDEKLNHATKNYLNWNNKVSVLSGNRITLAETYMLNSFAADYNLKSDLYKELLGVAIVKSNYGRSDIQELFAEAFSQWILTPIQERGLFWQKQDQFFRIELPRLLLIK